MAYHRPVTPELSIPALASWLRNNDPKDEYIYQDPARCLLGQYFYDHAAEEAISEAAYETFPDYRAIAEPKPHTFGAALTRAEALLALPAPNRPEPPPLAADLARTIAAGPTHEEVPEKQATPSAE